MGNRAKPNLSFLFLELTSFFIHDRIIATSESVSVLLFSVRMKGREGKKLETGAMCLCFAWLIYRASLTPAVVMVILLQRGKLGVGLENFVI